MSNSPSRIRLCQRTGSCQGTGTRHNSGIAAPSGMRRSVGSGWAVACVLELCSFLWKSPSGVAETSIGLCAPGKRSMPANGLSTEFGDPVSRKFGEQGQRRAAGVVCTKFISDVTAFAWYSYPDGLPFLVRQLRHIGREHAIRHLQLWNQAHRNPPRRSQAPGLRRTSNCPKDEVESG